MGEHGIGSYGSACMCLGSAGTLVHVFNCNWVDTRWQECSTHLHKNET